MLAAMLGTPLMEWQQYVADVLLEIDPETGELAYSEWGLTVPRQSGKTTLLLAKNSHRCMATGFFPAPQYVAYAAQTKGKATEKFEKDYANAIMRARRSHSQFTQVKVRTGNVKVDIRYPNGSTWAVESGTEKSGHGSVLDAADVDEAFSQQDNRLEDAFEPAMSTRVNHQLGVVSTAGWSDASPYLLNKVLAGRKAVREGVRRGLAYFEWSAPEDADPSDERVWLACMPAVHRLDCEPGCRRHTIRMDTIRGFYQKALRENKLSHFCRAYLNQWRPKPRMGEETALGDWAACEARVTEFPAVPTCIAVAVGRDRDAAVIGAAWLPDDETPPLVALVDQRPGVDWLAEEAARVSTTLGVPVVVHTGGPSAKQLADDIEAAGGRVIRADGEAWLEACNGIYDRVGRQDLRHPGHDVLTESVEGARWRPYGDGRRVFGWKASESDLSPTASVTLALWGAEQGATPDDVCEIY
jgi:hypothetical protein